VQNRWGDDDEVLDVHGHGERATGYNNGSRLLELKVVQNEWAM
jgi:hypothetical protein